MKECGRRITYTLTSGTVAFYDPFESLVNWFARRSYGERSAMATACVHKLPFSGFGKLSLMSGGLIGFPPGNTIISAYYISGLCLLTTKEEEGIALRDFL